MILGRRIPRDPASGIAHGAKPVDFWFAGREMQGLEGDTVASALLRAGAGTLNLYCGIGHCFGCHLTVDGIPGVRACLIPVRPGMRVEPDGQE